MVQDGQKVWTEWTDDAKTISDKNYCKCSKISIIFSRFPYISLCNTCGPGLGVIISHNTLTGFGLIVNFKIMGKERRISMKAYGHTRS